MNEREEKNRAPIDDVPGCAAPSRFRVLFLSSTVLYLNLNLIALLVPPPGVTGRCPRRRKAGLLLSEFKCLRFTL